MIVVTISGRQGSGKSRLAEQRYHQYCQTNRRVEMLDEGSYGTFRNFDPAKAEAEVRIVTRLTNTNLKESTDGPAV